MKRRIAHQGRSFAMYVEEATLPNGHTLELDVLRHPGAAAVVPFASDADVLLIRQHRHAAGGTIWEVPAGKLDGDTPRACAARELEEETGWRAGRWVELGSIWTSPGFTDERIHLFAAFDLSEGRQQLEAAEVIEVVRTPLARALDWVWSGRLCDAKSALALIRAARHVGAL